MSVNMDLLRAQLRRSPADWGLRLELAEVLVREGNGQQAAVLISTAPKDPPYIDSVLRAACLVMSLDSKLAMRFTDRALAQDEFNVDAALVRARIHQLRQEPEEAHLFAVVAAALDPGKCGSAPDLFGWLASAGLPVEIGSPVATSEAEPVEPEEEEVFAAAVIDESEPEAAAVVIMEDEEETVPPAVMKTEETVAPIAAAEAPPADSVHAEARPDTTVVSVAREPEADAPAEVSKQAVVAATAVSPT